MIGPGANSNKDDIHFKPHIHAGLIFCDYLFSMRDSELSQAGGLG